MPAPRLPKLPSIGELLEHPRLKHFVSRVNESTVARRAGSFLDEVRASLIKRAGEIETPSLSNLAERFAHMLLGEGRQNAAVINATGLVLGHSDLLPPLPERALDAALLAASEFHDATRTDAQRLLMSQTNAAGVVVTHSFQSAVQLALSALCGDGDVGLAGDEVTGGPTVLDWQSLAVDAGVAVRPLATANRLDLIVRTPEAGLTNDSSANYSAGTASSTDLAALASLASERGAKLVDVCPLAGLIDPANYELPSMPTVGDRLSGGCDIVVVDGAGLVGGPSCGILFCGKDASDRLAESRLAAKLSANPLVQSALAASIELYCSSSPPIHQIPVWQLLSAPLENLRQRAMRLAPLMNESAAVEAAEPIEAQSAWCRCGSSELKSPTWVVQLRAGGGDVARLSRSLTGGDHGLKVRHLVDDAENGSVLILDLRSVFPRWDQSLVNAVDRA